MVMHVTDNSNNCLVLAQDFRETLKMSPNIHAIHLSAKIQTAIPTEVSVYIFLPFIIFIDILLIGLKILVHILIENQLMHQHGHNKAIVLMHLLVFYKDIYIDTSKTKRQHAINFPHNFNFIYVLTN
jgi:hypothetical protein